MLKGFKDFILRGNVIELAVAVVIGSAFTAIVTAISTNLINPIIASLGSANMKGLGFFIKPGVDATFVDFGAVITASLNFLIVAAVVYFCFVHPMNIFADRRKRGQIEEEVPATESELLSEIRDLLAAQNGTGTHRN
ncbi:large conductance mechanosensitive channel protein MscL [Saxibacter everestensis]|uniref:Large-conductance mechanosensitive channel n=1 Tax=Saxibacter everestensis TaxID=2909229 RepID=A0ABY8QUT2_9MICO|nr:large conductance mechanosensitive channel protein MscL [Brevibacteriaceae bacterium ZFBP1038]